MTLPIIRQPEIVQIRYLITLQGANSKAITISTDVKDTRDLGAIAAVVTAQSGSTNITATADKKGNLVLTETDGNDAPQQVMSLLHG